VKLPHTNPVAEESMAQPQKRPGHMARLKTVVLWCHISADCLCPTRAKNTSATVAGFVLSSKTRQADMTMPLFAGCEWWY
jgi:hypothetical protein